MPTERRSIVFSMNEAIDAINAFRYALKEAMPNKPIVKFRAVSTAKGVAGEVQVQDGRNGETATIPVSPEHLAAALMAMCRTSRIPLPRRGVKSLTRIEDDVALLIELDAVTPLSAQRRAG
jgi:hypothetical protein